MKRSLAFRFGYKIAAFADRAGTKMRSVWCALFRHTPIEDACFGQWTCARCGEIQGDSWAGAYGGGISTSDLHRPGCKHCMSLLKTMRWYDWVLVPRAKRNQARINGSPEDHETIEAWAARVAQHKASISRMRDRMKEELAK